MTQQTLIWLEPECTTIGKRELYRLQRIEELFWKIESDLPSGLESWIDDDELHELRK